MEIKIRIAVHVVIKSQAAYDFVVRVWRMNVLRLLLVIVMLVLVGCTVGPNQLGFSASKWQAMSESEQQQVVENYRKIRHGAFAQKRIIYNGPDILVVLDKGTAMMPPFTKAYPFQRAVFRIRPGTCQSIRLASAISDNSVNLKACYNGLTLMFDPSRYDATKSGGSLRFDYNPVWKRGFTYADVSSSGYVRLSHADVKIKALPIMVPVEDVNDFGN